METSTQNPFHQIEFNEEEFLDLLHTHFKAVRLYVQFLRSAAWWSYRSLAAEHSPWLRIKGFWRAIVVALPRDPQPRQPGDP